MKTDTYGASAEPTGLSSQATEPASRLGSDELQSLALRCEQASGLSGHLDAQIFILLDQDAQHIVGEKPGRFPRDPIYGPRSSFWEWATDYTIEPPILAYPCYTASLDAAMTLVPEGYEAGFAPASGDRQAGYIYERTPFRNVVRVEPWGQGATPALALCAAALRARALAPIETGTAKTEGLGAKHESGK